MTKLLERAFKQVSELPEPEQDALAKRLLDAVRDSKKNLTPNNLNVESSESFEKSKWALFADKMHKESPLRGKSGKLVRLGRDFRDSFSF